MVEYIIKEGDYNDEIMDELVRCKDCKYADIFHQCDRVEFWTSGDDFCSRGERKDEGEDE